MTPKDHFERHLYFPHFRGGRGPGGVEKIHTFFFFEGFPKLMGSVRNCMFLLPLYEILVPGMELPVNLVTRAVMESVEAADDETVHKMRLAPQKVMNEVSNCLPLWLK